MSTNTEPSLTDQIELIIREAVTPRGSRVEEWPGGEATAYRAAGGFAPGSAAAESVRVDTLVAEMLEVVESEVRIHQSDTLEAARVRHEQWKFEFERAQTAVARLHAVQLQLIRLERLALENTSENASATMRAAVAAVREAMTETETVEP